MRVLGSAVLLLAFFLVRCGGIDTHPFSGQGAAGGDRTAGAITTTGSIQTDGGMLGALIGPRRALAAEAVNGNLRGTIQLYGRAAIDFLTRVQDGSFSVRTGRYVCSGAVDANGTTGGCLGDNGEQIPFQTQTAGPETEVRPYCASNVDAGGSAWYMAIVEGKVLAGLWSPQRGPERLAGQMRGKTFTLIGTSGARYEGVVDNGRVQLTREGKAVDIEAANCPALLGQAPGGPGGGTDGGSDADTAGDGAGAEALVDGIMVPADPALDAGAGDVPAEAGPYEAPPPSLVRIAVTPAQARIAVTLVQQMAATLVFSNGSTLDATREVTWTSSDPSVAAVISAGARPGVVAGVKEGMATISASFAGVGGSTVVTIVPILF